MEIADLNLIGDFEAGMKCLQNPSIISNLSLIDKVPKLYSFWTCGALIIAVFATFTSVFIRIKMFVHQIRRRFLASCQNSCPQQIFDDDDFDFEFSEDDCDDDTPSSVAESDDEEMESDDDRVVFRAEGDGGFSLRRRNGFSWSDFSAGKSVVQLWDSFGLGLDFEDDDESDYSAGGISIWDLNRDVKLSSGRRCRVPAASAAENVVVTAEMSDTHCGVGFGTYDSRVGGRSPAIYAAWRPPRRGGWVAGASDCDGDDSVGVKEE